MENAKAIIEALILASEAPLGLDKICAAVPEVGKEEARRLIDSLVAEYQERGGGIVLQEVAGGFQFRTRPEFGPWIKKLKGTKPAALSPSVMETLAIIAYRQPIVKTEIESIRGVDAGHALKVLLEKRLVRILGRKDVPGKPIIYGTTKKFLEVFNLKNLSELPTLRELKELNEPADNMVPVDPADVEDDKEVSPNSSAPPASENSREDSMVEPVAEAEGSGESPQTEKETTSS